MAYNMLHRLFNKGGHWHRAATLNKKEWTRFEFDMSWENLNRMYSIRQYYAEIAPPFSKQVILRIHEMEMLHDDIMYYHIKRSWYNFIAWIVFTLAFNFDELEKPFRPSVCDDMSSQDFPKLREGVLV